MGLAGAWQQVLAARVCRPPREGHTHGAEGRDHRRIHGDNSTARAFSFHRSMDTMGAVVGPPLALLLLGFFRSDYRRVFWLSIIPARGGGPRHLAFIRETRQAPCRAVLEPRNDPQAFRLEGEVLHRDRDSLCPRQLERCLPHPSSGPDRHPYGHDSGGLPFVQPGLFPFRRPVWCSGRQVRQEEHHSHRIRLVCSCLCQHSPGPEALPLFGCSLRSTGCSWDSPKEFRRRFLPRSFLPISRQLPSAYTGLSWGWPCSLQVSSAGGFGTASHQQLPSISAEVDGRSSCFRSSR